MEKDLQRDIPREIIVEIFQRLELKELIKLTYVNKYIMQIIRKVKWDHFIVRLLNVEKIKLVLENYNFMKYDFSYTKITDDIVKELKNCHTLYLRECKITDASVKELKNCHTLYLSYCKRITDASVKKLKNCHTLNLSWCQGITDASVKENLAT